MAGAGIDAAVRGILAANTAVRNLVSTRIHADELPLRCSYPAISILLITDIPDPDIPDLQVARVQVDCWSRTKSPTELNSVVQAVISALHHPRLNGINTTWVAGDTSFHVIESLCVFSMRTIEMETSIKKSPVDFSIVYRK
jgi:hypothetical protein